MAKNFLTGFPSPGELLSGSSAEPGTFLFEANCHIHTPFSFSAFDDLDSLFRKAAEEKIDVLGINDFFVTDGYRPFHEGCTGSRIFPLFNIEFIGLMTEEQANKIRINDPNNPGRIYFCGKGLDYPFHLGKENLKLLSAVKKETQKQLMSMISRLNNLIEKRGFPLRLDFEVMHKRFAHELVRERHIAKALRYLAAENFSTDEERIRFIETLYGDKKSEQGFSDPAALENEIRSNLLKAGGSAFVEEDEKSFLPVKKIIEIIIDAGGIPCYPVLLDDPSGKFTEFEDEREKLMEALNYMGVGCIELIPGRNAHQMLSEFVEYFDKHDFIITFGTEHNTPVMVPLTVTAKNGMPLDERLKQINRRGACVVAAHQYLHAQEQNGYIGADGKPLKSHKREFESIGQSVIEFYLRGKQK
ncbi:MAG: PHP domain-containing protein [Bacteroidales bacterium]